MGDLLELEAIESATTGETTELATVPQNFELQSFNDLFQKAQRLETANPIVSITPKYLEFTTIGETRRGVYLGVKELTKGDQTTIDAIQWLEADGEVYLNAGRALVDALQSVPMGTSIEIIYRGKKATGSGYKVNLFDVKLLVTDAPF